MKVNGETITTEQIHAVLARWSVDIGGCRYTARACRRALKGCWHSRWQVADAYREILEMETN